MARALRGGATAQGALDRITNVVSSSLGAPIALVSIVDDREQTFLGATGLTGDVAEEGSTPLSHSFCQHVVTRDAPLVVRDAHENDIVRGNLAIEDLGVVGYAGMPLRVGGQVLGSLCAIDHAPREWTARELETLRRHADLVEYLMGLEWPAEDQPATGTQT